MFSFTDVMLIALLWVNILILFLLGYPHLSKLRRKNRTKISYATMDMQEPPQIKVKPKLSLRKNHGEDDFYKKLLEGGEK
jgi:hypothetical protein